VTYRVCEAPERLKRLASKNCSTDAAQITDGRRSNGEGVPLRFRNIQRLREFSGFAKDSFATFFQSLQIGEVDRMTQLPCIFVVFALQAFQPLHSYSTMP
jgi:hypothetical protein